jgi:intraflagellar transport protein 88
MHVQAAFNMIVCFYALGDKEGMRSSFLRLLALPGLAPEGEDTDDDDEEAVGTPGALSGALKGSGGRFAGGAAADGLQDDQRQKQAYIKKCILSSAQLVSDQIEQGFDQGFDWCAEQLRQRGFPKLSAEVQLAKADKYLRLKDLDAAARVFKDFEKKESVVR